MVLPLTHIQKKQRKLQDVLPPCQKFNFKVSFQLEDVQLVVIETTINLLLKVHTKRSIH